MMNKMFCALLAIVVLCLSAFGQQQNARVAAMGGADILPDISRIVNFNPAEINLYKNQVQATFNAPIFGTISTGNVLSVGLLLNRGLTMPSATLMGTTYSFYTEAVTLMNTPLNNGNPANGGPFPGGPDNPLTGTTQYYPHILLGFDFASIQLGLDLYFERTATSFKDVAAGVTTKEDMSINNPGVVLGARFLTGNVALGLRFGASLPTMNAQMNVSSATINQTWKAETETGSAMKATVEAQFPLLSCQWAGGVDWDNESFQFSLTPNGATQKTRLDVNNFNVITPYLGFTKEILNNVRFVVQDRSAINLMAQHNDADNVKASATVANHTISTGLEQQVAGLLGFDSLGIRGGLNCVITSTSTHYEDNTANATTDEGMVTTVGNVVPNIGVGVSKGAFTFDLMLAPGSWNNGLVAGPQVGRVTATCRF
jgi:hypothetical protein